MSVLRPIGDALTQVPESVRVDPSATYRNVGILNKGRGLFEKQPLRGADTAYTSLFPLTTNQLVYSKLFAWEGAVGVVPERFDGAFVSSEFPHFHIDPRLAFPAYIRHVTSWAGFVEQLQGLTSGLGQRRQRVNVPQFLSARVPLPPIEEQGRIAAHLDQVATQVDAAQREAGQADGRTPAQLPVVIAQRLRVAQLPTTTVRDLCSVVNDTIHPGDSTNGAETFVGLEHIESHTGQRVGGRPVSAESGRKFRFEAGHITFGYLRPYLNKVWCADRVGLCSVEQFVLSSGADVNPELLAYVLRSSIVLDQAIEATNSLQLPRLRLATLLECVCLMCGMPRLSC